MPPGSSWSAEGTIPAGPSVSVETAPPDYSSVVFPVIQGDRQTLIGWAFCEAPWSPCISGGASTAAAGPSSWPRPWFQKRRRETHHCFPASAIHGEQWLLEGRSHQSSSSLTSTQPDHSVVSILWLEGNPSSSSSCWATTIRDPHTFSPLSTAVIKYELSTIPTVGK